MAIRGESGMLQALEMAEEAIVVRATRGSLVHYRPVSIIN